jgi:hypothetical protein
MLFDRARADVQFLGNFPIGAALHQEFQNLCVAARDFDVIEIDHAVPPSTRTHVKQVFRQSFATIAISASLIDSSA